MNVLVTGGAGFIGSHICRALLEGGHEVWVLDNLSSGRRANLAGVAVELVEGDITEIWKVRQTIRRATHVVHLAAMVSVPRSVENPRFCHEVNVTGTLNVLFAAREAGVHRVVFASSSAVYGDAGETCKREDMAPQPVSPYGESKLAAEKQLATFYARDGLETVALRYFNVFGPRQDPRSQYAAVVPRFISALLEGRRPVIFGNGEQTRDFTFVANVVHGTLLALSVPGVAGQVMNLATGRTANLLELARLLGQITGSSLEPEHAPPRPGDIIHSGADISRARDMLKFEPVVNLREGLIQTVEWFRSQTETTG